MLSQVDIAGRDVLDVGAGTGLFAQQLASKGARVIGVEIEEDKVSRFEDSAHPFEMRLGRGEALPVEDNSQDVVTYMFSFHHVPLGVQDDALNEVRRVLRFGGRLHVVDPRPYGAMLEVVKFVDDETEVRTRSQMRLDGLSSEDGLECINVDEYVLDRTWADFAGFVKHVVGVDPSRNARLDEAKDEMEQAFERFGERNDTGVMLSQPCAAYHFEFAR